MKGEAHWGKSTDYGSARNCHHDFDELCLVYTGGLRHNDVRNVIPRELYIRNVTWSDKL